jgi:hypothetical protein
MMDTQDFLSRLRSIADEGRYVPVPIAEFERFLAHVESLAVENDALKGVCASAYQMAGVAGAPERFLDALSDAANGEVGARAETQTLLPVGIEEFDPSGDDLDRDGLLKHLAAFISQMAFRLKNTGNPVDDQWAERGRDFLAVHRLRAKDTDPREKNAKFGSEPLTDADIRAVMLENGFSIKEGLSDLKPYVYAAARELERLIDARHAIRHASHASELDRLKSQIERSIEQLEIGLMAKGPDVDSKILSAKRILSQLLTGRPDTSGAPDPSSSMSETCWLVELFDGDGTGASRGRYHTGFTDLSGLSRTTKNPHDARRYTSQAEADAVAEKLGQTLTGTWRATEHSITPVVSISKVVRSQDVAPGSSSPYASPSVEAAREMGAKGGPVVEAERLAFEAWMAGHCWSLSAHWTGKGYKSDSESSAHVDPGAMRTRQLWAAWRDRAALSASMPKEVRPALEAGAPGESNVFVPPPPPVFPTMLRKMWSGDEVQKWINANWPTTKSNAVVPSNTFNEESTPESKHDTTSKRPKP